MILQSISLSGCSLLTLTCRIYPVYEAPEGESESESENSVSDESVDSASSKRRGWTTMRRKEEVRELTEEEKKLKEKRKEWSRKVMRRIGLLPPTIESINMNWIRY